MSEGWTHYALHAPGIYNLTPEPNILLFKRPSTDPTESLLLDPLERQSLDLLDLEASVDVREMHQSPLRRKSLSTRLSLSRTDDIADKEDEEGGILELPSRPLKQTLKGCKVSDVISETVAENVELVDVDLLRSRARPEAAPEGFDLVSEKKEKRRGKRSGDFGDEEYGERKKRVK
jgi:hypothetical protein